MTIHPERLVCLTSLSADGVQSEQEGAAPKVASGACATVIGECLYWFGGWYVRKADVHQLNLETLTWKKLTQDRMKGGPMCKDKAGMVDYGEEMLCVMAGYGYQQDGFVRQEGASYHQNPDSSMSWTNELHLFHISACKWMTESIGLVARSSKHGNRGFARFIYESVVLEQPALN